MQQNIRGADDVQDHLVHAMEQSHLLDKLQTEVRLDAPLDQLFLQYCCDFLMTEAHFLFIVLWSFLGDLTSF